VTAPFLRQESADPGISGVFAASVPIGPGKAEQDKVGEERAKSNGSPPHQSNGTPNIQRKGCGGRKRRRQYRALLEAIIAAQST